MNLLLLTATIGDKLDTAFFGFDTFIYSIFGSIQNSFLTIIAKMFTSFGDEAFVIPIAILALVLCFFKRTRKYGCALIFAIAIGTVVTNVVVKPMVLRIRPYNTLQTTDFWAKYGKWYAAAGSLSESDYSFPSGHTTAAFEVATAVFLCFRSDKKKFAWVFPVIAFFTMCSRIYLMVHYPTDVIAGFFVGTLAGICAFFLAKLALLIWSKIKFLDAIDAEKLFKKGLNTKAASYLLAAAVVGIFCFSFIPSLSEGADFQQTCAYNEEYDCMNTAKVDDEDYPPIDGEYYCKIHWKQLQGETED